MILKNILFQFLIWGIISISYYFSKFATKTHIKSTSGDTRVSFVEKIIIYVTFLLVAAGICWVLYYMFSLDKFETDDDGTRKELLGMHFHFLELFVPVAVPTILGIIRGISTHNKSIVQES